MQLLDELPDLNETPKGGLSLEVETVCFQRMTHLRDMAAADPTSAGICLEQAAAIRDFVIRANLGLAMFQASRELRLHGHRRTTLAELRSDCYLDLIRAVDLFSLEFGTRFSTFATVCMRRNCFVRGKRAARQSTRFKAAGCGTNGDDFDRLGTLVDTRSFWSRDQQKRQRVAIAGLLKRLSERSRQIIVARFGLDDGDAKSTETIGRQIGVTSQRVHQLEKRAMAELKRLATWVEVT